jgi:hypothetical protein
MEKVIFQKFLFVTILSKEALCLTRIEFLFVTCLHKKATFLPHFRLKLEKTPETVLR